MTVTITGRKFCVPVFNLASGLRTPILPQDVNADGWPDLVWRHMGSGHNAVWLMKGPDVAQTTFLLPAGADQLSDLNWEIRALGDLNRDGRPDVIWQHKLSGQLAVWYLSSYNRIGTTYIYKAAGGFTEPDVDWKIVAAGDVNRDGQVDLLWRHRTSGAIRLWHMNGNVQLNSVPLGTVSNNLWEIAGLADMNGDGWLDLLWRNYGDGTIASWPMNDTRIVNTLWVTPANPDNNWRIVGVADMNRDGTPDLLWQHVINGQLGVWYMRGLDMIGGGYLNPWMVGDPNWRIVGVK